MADTEKPQTYLITPPQFRIPAFSDQLSAVLDAHEVSCLRVAMATADVDEVSKSADALREICHAREVAIVIDSHYKLVAPHGLDGCHVQEAARFVRGVRQELGLEAIVGASCGTEKHGGMTAANAGADYVSFGPVAASELGSGDVADTDLFKWWSEMIETPVIAEGGMTVETVRTLAPYCEFLAFGEEIWSTDDPAKALGELLEPIA